MARIGSRTAWILGAALAVSIGGIAWFGWWWSQLPVWTVRVRSGPPRSVTDAEVRRWSPADLIATCEHELAMHGERAGTLTLVVATRSHPSGEEAGAVRRLQADASRPGGWEVLHSGGQLLARADTFAVACRIAARQCVDEALESYAAIPPEGWPDSWPSVAP